MPLYGNLRHHGGPVRCRSPEFELLLREFELRDIPVCEVWELSTRGNALPRPYRLCDNHTHYTSTSQDCGMEDTYLGWFELYSDDLSDTVAWQEEWVAPIIPPFPFVLPQNKNLIFVFICEWTGRNLTGRSRKTII